MKRSARQSSDLFEKSKSPTKKNLVVNSFPNWQYNEFLSNKWQVVELIWEKNERLTKSPFFLQRHKNTLNKER